MKKFKFILLVGLSFLSGVFLTDFIETKTGFSFSKHVLVAEVPIGEEGEYYFYNKSNSHFPFVLKAENKTVLVYEEWNSWGWFERSFSAQDEYDPKLKYLIYRRRGTWDRNFPSTYKIEPGKYLITEINLCDGTWTIEPKLDEKVEHHLMLQGHFDIENKKIEDPTKIIEDMFGNSWTGHLDTNKFSVVISKEAAKILNHPIEW